MTPQESSKAAYDICALAPVIPVLIVEETLHAAPLASALIEGGLRVLEVTLRTENALNVISEMAKQDGAIIGAGTLLSPQQVRDAKAAGAQFGVSPGATDAVLETALEEKLPMLPGAITPSEVMVLLEKGYDMLKFFPAAQAGGASMLKSFSSPLASARFCPTGGVSPENAHEYLSLPNVVCVGGSWVAHSEFVNSSNWKEITKRAVNATRL